MAMLFTYQSNPDEGIQAITAAGRAVTPKWAGLPAIGVTLLLVAAFARLTSHNWREIAGFTFAALWLVVLLSQLEQRLRWTRAIEKDPHAAEEHQVEVTDHGIVFSCAYARSELAWAGVRRVQETPSHYLFVCGPLGACAVPKRAVSDSDDDALRSLVRAHSPDGGAHLARDVGSAAPAT